jgi:hypothetical protein
MVKRDRLAEKDYSSQFCGTKITHKEKLELGNVKINRKFVSSELLY